MGWDIRVTKSAQKGLERIPQGYARLVQIALQGLEVSPFRGDVQKLGPASWRRRVASYRIFFDVYYDDQVIVVTAITRRQSNTY